MQSGDLDDLSGNLKDLTIFENFTRDWDSDKLTDSNPIVKTVKSISRGAGRFGWESWSEDIEQIILLKIRNCNYSGEGSLEGYIRKAIQNEINTLFDREHQAKRDNMPDDVKVETDIHKRLEEEEEEKASLRRVEEIIFRTPKHLMWFIETVLGAEEFMSERKISKELGITRHQVVKAKKELQKIFQDMESGQSDKSQTAKFK